MDVFLATYDPEQLLREIRQLVLVDSATDPDLEDLLLLNAESLSDVLLNVGENESDFQYIETLFVRDVIDGKEALLRRLWQSVPQLLDRLRRFPPSEKDLSMLARTKVVLDLWLKQQKSRRINIPESMNRMRLRRARERAERKKTRQERLVTAVRKLPPRRIPEAIPPANTDEENRYRVAIDGYRKVRREMKTFLLQKVVPKDMLQNVGAGITNRFKKSARNEWIYALRMLVYAEFTGSFDRNDWKDLSILVGESKVFDKIFGTGTVFKDQETYQRIRGWAQNRVFNIPTTEELSRLRADYLVAKDRAYLTQALGNDMMDTMNTPDSVRNRFNSILDQSKVWENQVMRHIRGCVSCGSAATFVCGACQTTLYCGAKCAMVAHPCEQ